MRIALVTDWWAPRIGGIESQLLDLARSLASRGHSVRVLTTTSEPTPVDDVEVEHIATAMMRDVAVPDLRRVRELAGIINAGRPDIVHSHGMFSPLAIGGVLAARRVGVPSVATVHSLLAPWHVFAAASAIFRMFLNRASLVTGVSSAVVSDIERASGREAECVPNGLDVEAWRRAAPQPADQQEIRIVGVLRLVPKKQPLDLVAAFHRAALANPRLPMTLTVAGDGPMRPQVEREIARRQIEERVRLAGDCSREQVRALLSRASILVHPGRLEAFGLALLEARAAGVPVVAMRAGGVPEVVVDGQTGLLANTTAELAAKLVVLAEDPRLRARMSAACAEGLDRFAWDAIAARYEDIYRRTAARRLMEYDGAKQRHDPRAQHAGITRPDDRRPDV